MKLWKQLGAVCACIALNVDARMPADHWIGPFVTPEEYVAANQSLYALDQKGVLITYYRDDLKQTEPRIEYNPAFIANYAITACRHYLRTGDAAARSILETQLQWLLGNRKVIQHDGETVWLFEYNFPWLKFQLSAPWVSAFAQALVGTAFACGSDATGDKEYADAVDRTFLAFAVPMNRGGVTTFEGTSAWFEEAARYDAPTTKIFPGHMVALLALWTVLEWRPDAELEKLFWRGVEAVKRRLSEFDSGYISHYAQYPKDRRSEWELAGRDGYNARHVIQLMSLFEITNDPAFAKTALRFAQYETPGWVISTLGSTDAVTHGPDQLSMVLGNAYWSHSTFPTWVLIDLGAVQHARGITVISHTPSSTPRKFAVSTSINGRDFSQVFVETDNRYIRFTRQFPERRARYVRVDIQADNGNGNVALEGIYVHRREPIGAVVANPTAISEQPMPARSFSEYGWAPPRDGYLIFDAGALAGPRTGFALTFVNGGEVEIAAGDDLKTWRNAMTVQLGDCSSRCELVMPNLAGRYRLMRFKSVAVTGSSRLFIYPATPDGRAAR